MSNLIFAQRSVDSLESILQQSKHDTLKVDVLLLLSSATSDNFQRSLNYLNEGIALSHNIDDRRRLSRCYLALAQKYDYNGNLFEAKQALSKVEKLLDDITDIKVESRFYDQRGIIYYFEGAYNEAVADFWSAIRLYEEQEDDTRVAACYINLGNSYKELEDRVKALEYYQKGLELYQHNGNDSGAAMAVGNIGSIYRSMHAYDKALDYLNESLAYNRKNNLKEDIVIDLNNIGNVYLEKEDYATALDYFKKSFAVADSANLERGKLIARFNMGIVELKLKRFEKAIQIFEDLLVVAKARNFREDIKDVYEILSVAYEDAGKFKKSLHFRKEFEIWRDSLINENHLNEVKEQEIRYQTEQKDKQIEILAIEKELQQKEVQRQATLKKAFIAGFILVLIVIGLVTYTFLQRIKNQKALTIKNDEIKEINFKRQLGELEMKALRAQINPHFLFNCINSINRMVVKGDGENASLYLKKFSKLVRLIVENAESTQVSLENELSLVESYIQLEKLRFKGKIGYEIEVNPAVEKENTYIPSMLLQPFVENAIWHGLMHKGDDEQGQIVIGVKEMNDILICTIEDNGVGREKSQALKEKSLIKTKSMGMKITEERLRLLNRGSASELIRIIDLKDALGTATGTRIEINIPLS